MYNSTKNEIAVSIIVPVYNSEAYLEDCVNSILDQSLINFELLLIDDGSTDRSGIVCDELSKIDNRISVIHKENEGMCATRNLGIAVSKGEYITFCDNDDKVLDNFLLDNYNYAKENNVDVVRFLRDVVRMNHNQVLYSSKLKNIGNHYWSQAEAFENYADLRSIGGGVWTGLYRKNFLVEYDIKFDESMKSGMEDLDFNLKVYKHMASIYINSKSYYLWIQRDDHSTSRKFKMNFIDSLVKCVNREFNLVEDYKIDSVYFMELIGNTYVYGIVNSLLLPSCPLNYKEKIDLIKSFRNSFMFSVDPTKLNLKKLREKNSKAYLVYFLFLKRKFKTLYRIIALQQKLKAN